MKKVNSVLGSLPIENLGFTLSHEHIIVSPAGFFRDYPELLGNDVVERVINELKKLKQGGIDTIIDASTSDLGRDINLLVNVSLQSGINIIACTGWWLDIPPWFDGIKADQLAAAFTRDVEQGISGTNVKAGILKAASDIGGVKPQEEIILRAVAQAHHKTGVPIMLHSYAPEQVGRQQLTILREEGVDLTAVKIDHCNDTADMGYLVWLLDQGCYLGMDRHPGPNIDLVQRTKTLKKLIDAGYADRLCPSHDMPIASILSLYPHLKKRQKLNPHGHLYIKRILLPHLQAMGTSDTVIRRLCIDGPKKLFEGCK